MRLQSVAGDDDAKSAERIASASSRGRTLRSHASLLLLLEPL